MADQDVIKVLETVTRSLSGLTVTVQNLVDVLKGADIELPGEPPVPVEPSKPVEPPVPVDPPKPVEPETPDIKEPPPPVVVTRTPEQLEAHVASRFRALTEPRGYVGGATPSEGAMAEWRREAVSQQAAYGWTKAQEILEEMIAKDVETYFPVRSSAPAPSPAPTPAPAPAPTLAPVPSGNDERPSIALIRDRMNARMGHEAIPSIAESFPSWGVLSNIIFTPDTNPTNQQWGSYPPHVSTRTSAMGWFVAAGTRGMDNTSDNSALRIWVARAYLWLNNGRRLSVSGHDRGNMTLDAGMRWSDNNPPPLFVGSGTSTIRGINDKRISNGAYDNRNWHPTMPVMTPGGPLRNSSVACLVAVQSSMVPIDPSKPNDWQKAGVTLYVGEDGYSPQQDGFSGRFIKVEERKRWNFAFCGDWSVLTTNPPDLEGWAG